MEVTKKSRLQLRIQNLIFYTGFISAIILLAYLSNKYNFQYDLTATGKHTLSDASITALGRLPQKIKIRVFVRDVSVQPIRKIIADKLLQYSRIKNDIEIEYINPDTNPDVIRKLGIKVDGELIVEYNGRSEHLEYLSEQLLTNTLLRLLRSDDKNIVFITGHGERRTEGKANYDLQIFTRYLNKIGIKTTNIDLYTTPVIPANTAALVIASTQVEYLPGEIKIINNYLQKGGNLLWIHEPGPLLGFEELAAKLNISFEEGTVVDPSAQLLGIDSPTISIISKYDSHPITKDFSIMTLFPQAIALKYNKPDIDSKSIQWKSSDFLKTVARSWSETGVLQGNIQFSAENDIPGPLSIGIALSRSINNKDQRIVVLGDGDFISNSFVGNQGNRDLGVNIFNWLSHDDNFISIPTKIAIDKNISLDIQTWSIIAFLFLIILPSSLVIAGVVIWRKRANK